MVVVTSAVTSPPVKSYKVLVRHEHEAGGERRLQGGDRPALVEAADAFSL